MIGTLSLPLGRLSTMTEALGRRGDLPAADGATAGRLDAESSFVLLHRARDGDGRALDELCARYLPRLQRWAHGRLPAWARGALDTHDLVQDTFAGVIQHIHEFEPRHEGAFFGYLRQALLNRVRDEIRKSQRRSPAEPLDTEQPARAPSPLEEAIGAEALERYDAALQRLRDTDRDAIILRVELAYSYAEIADALGKPSLAAAQMTVSRALVKLAQEMSHARD
jgi:RNA polymerase sigma-70 factor (ECF subfamily)